MNTSEIVLIDLSSLAYPIWHTSTADPVPNAVKTKIVARVRSIASGKAYVAVCCDSGRSFRHDIDTTYKANRPPREEALHFQIRLACEQLKADGFPVWSVPGFEADDLIASAVERTLALDGMAALVVSSDKDLLQLVSDRVRAMSATNGNVFNADDVRAKFGVDPGQMRDYLTLVGDASDNVKGAKGIGEKKASNLLALFGSVEGLYAAIDRGEVGIKPAELKALQDFRPQVEQTRSLIALRTDVALPFEELLQDRTPRPASIPGFDEETDDMDATTEPEAQTPDVVTEPALAAPAPPTALVPRQDVLAPAPAEWERQLEPRSMKEATTLAKFMFDSGLFSAYGTPQAVMSTILAGRELGLTAMASLRAIHVVEGRPTLSADLIRALVIRSGKAKFFRCTERTATHATFQTQRDDDPPMSLTFTIEEATLAGVVKDKSAWVKSPADMLVARASAKLARLVYPDVVHGLYLADEIGSGDEVAA